MPDKKSFIHGYALVVGVGNYKQTSLSVPVTAQDAEDLGRLLVNPQFCGYPENQVEVLTNQSANRTQILAGLDEIKDKAKQDDNSSVLIFFSGHGWQQDGYYFLPHEAAIANVAGKASVDFDSVLANEDFLEKVRKIPAQRLVILFNTCFAGAVGTALSPEIQKLPEFATVPLGPYEKLAGGSGRVIISSSLAGERSWIRGGAKNSLFVEHVLAGLRGKAVVTNQDTIRIFDLFDYLSREVPADAKTLGVTQTPVMKVYDATRNFPVSLLMGGAGSSPAGAETVSRKITYNTTTIQKLLSEAFTDEGFTRFTMDYFPGVFEQFSIGMTKSQRIQLVIEYCNRHNQFPHLLDLVRSANPDIYAKYVARLRASNDQSSLDDEREYDLARIRKLLMSFSESELRNDLRLEVPEFRPAFAYISEKASLSDLVAALIDWGVGRLLMTVLLEWARGRAPTVYARYQPYWRE